MEFSNRRVYSINMAVHLISQGFKYIMGLDEVTGKVFWRFPEDESTRKVIMEYKKDEKLHKFINTFYVVRSEMKQFEKEHKGVS
jgi:hypothetical protein